VHVESEPLEGVIAAQQFTRRRAARPAPAERERRRRAEGPQGAHPDIQVVMMTGDATSDGSSIRNGATTTAQRSTVNGVVTWCRKAWSTSRSSTATAARALVQCAMSCSFGDSRAWREIAALVQRVRPSKSTCWWQARAAPAKSSCAKQFHVRASGAKPFVR